MMKAVFAAITTLVSGAWVADDPENKICTHDLLAPKHYSMPCFNQLSEQDLVQRMIEKFGVYDIWNPK